MQIEMHFLTHPPLGPNAIAVADQRHSSISSGSTEGRQYGCRTEELTMKPPQIEDPVDLSQ
jgi:hypothetical protein